MANPNSNPNPDWRLEMSAKGVHRPMVAGIWGNEALGGAYSLVMNGGYEVNPNLTKLPKLSDPNSDTASRTIMIKVIFTYTGSGGRDLSGNKLHPHRH